MSLDSKSRAILRQLRLDGRMPNNALAAAVGLSPSACLRRVEILERTGVIKGYTAIIGAEVDDGITAIVRITLERQTEEYLNRFEAAVRRHPEIEECFLMTGESDYVLRTVAQNAADYERIHKVILSKLPGVSRIHSSIAIRRVLLTTPK